MIALEFQADCVGRWKVLSVSSSPFAASWQMFGWMALYRNGGWRTTEVSNMSSVQELVTALRGRQATVDATAVLEACEQAGIGVGAVEGNLKVHGRLTDELRESLKRCKADILRIIADRPPWDEEEAASLIAKSTACAQGAEKYLADRKCIFVMAGRAILADSLGAIQRAKACGHLSQLRSRVDWLIGWAGTLDKQLLRLREPMDGERKEAYAVQAAFKAATVQAAAERGDRQ